MRYFIALFFVICSTNVFSQINGDDFLDLMGRDLSTEPWKSKWQQMNPQNSGACGYYFNRWNSTIKESDQLEKVTFGNMGNPKSCGKTYYPFGLKWNMGYDAVYTQLKKYHTVTDDPERQLSCIIDGEYGLGIRPKGSFDREYLEVSVELTSAEMLNRLPKSQEELELAELDFFDENDKRAYTKNREWNNFIFAGDVKQGKCVSGNCNSGQGVMEWADGRRFSGEFGGFQKGIPYKGTFEFKHKVNGKCTITNAVFIKGFLHGDKNDNMQIEGNGVKGHISSFQGMPKAIKLEEKGAWFEGDLGVYALYPSGNGTIHFSNGTQINAEFRKWNEVNSGDAEINYPDGNQYIGKVTTNFIKHGPGKVIYDGGKMILTAQFENDIIVGEGTLFYPDLYLVYKGPYDLAKGFYGNVTVSTHTFSGDFVASGQFNNNFPTGKHELKNLDGKVIATANYDQNGKLVSGKELYSPSAVVSSAEQMKEDYYKNELPKLLDQLRARIESENLEYKIEEIDIKPGKNERVVFKTKVAVGNFATPYTDYRMIVLDPGGKISSYQLSIYTGIGETRWLRDIKCLPNQQGSADYYSEPFQFQRDILEKPGIEVTVVGEGLDPFCLPYKGFVLIVRGH